MTEQSETRPSSGSIRPRRGRPTSAKLTQDRIAEAALAIIDERGWDALTMNALASRLHVRAPSLYHHIESQADLIHLVRRIIVRKIDTANLDQVGWEEAIRSFGMSYYRAFLRHPNTIQTLSVTPIHDPETFAMYEAFLGALDREGWTGERALEILVGLEYLALGSAFEANATDVMLVVERAEENNAPILAKFLRERAIQGLEVVESTFVQLLEDFITMFRLERERVESRSEPAPRQRAAVLSSS